MLAVSGKIQELTDGIIGKRKKNPQKPKYEESGKDRVSPPKIRIVF